MKKYTIIYVQVKHSMRTTTVHSDKIESDDVAKLIEAEKYKGNVCFIYDGWPEEV